jgi:hypothetical protein
MILDMQAAQKALGEWLGRDPQYQRYEVVTSGTGARVARLQLSEDLAGVGVAAVETLVGSLLATSAGTADTWGITSDRGSFSLGRIKARGT